jgi:DNA-directed RNA polymerase subunit RPC12/RpoP
LIHNSEFILNSGHNQNIYKIISKTENKTIISVPADPQIEELELAAHSSGGREIKFQIPIERIYWSIGNDSQDWQDKLIELRKDDFLKSNKSLSIKLPSIAWTSRVKVGFQNRDKRDYLISLDSKILKINLSDFSDSHYEMTSSGRFTIECELIHNDEDIKFSPCQLVTELSCQYCGDFRSFDFKEIVKHLFNEHFNSLFSDPLYAEINSRIPDLPIYIYKCSHCKKYVSSFTDHPTSEIIKHTDDIHRGKNVEFRVVKRIDEIREFVLSDLPSFKKCKLCDEILEVIDCEEHFIKFHKDIIYK